MAPTSYLSCNGIKNCNNAWQAATESDPNQTCQNNTKDGKEDIKCQENHSQPAKIQNQRSSAENVTCNIERIMLHKSGSLIYLEELWFFYGNTQEFCSNYRKSYLP